MAFQNRFALSFSQASRFSKCPRRWWLEKVLAWRGWEKSADPGSRLAYRCKQMTGMFALAGREVHAAAARAIAQGVPLSKNQEVYERQMRAGYRQALAEAKKEESDRAKHKVNLFELYYSGHGIDDVDRYARSAYDRGMESLPNIYLSQAYEGAAEGEVAEQECLEQIEIGDVPVWVVVDLAYWSDEGFLWLWDWKTGRKSSRDKRQLAVYAAYAMEKYDASLEDLRLGLAYLYEGQDEIVDVTSADLANARNALGAVAQEIRKRLPDPRINDAQESLFPATEVAETCRRCEMFHPCKGHRDVSQPR